MSGEQLFNTKKGKALLKTISMDDLCGHGTIRAYYGIDALDGTDREYTDFTKPERFPPQIVTAIKEGKMRGLGTFPKGLLLEPLDDKYEADRKPLDDKYEADRKPLNDKYWADLKPLDDKYWADLKPLDDKYEADLKPLDDKYWELFANPENRVEEWR